MSNYTIQYKYGKRARENLLILGRFYFHFVMFSTYSGAFFPFAGYELIIVNSALISKEDNNVISEW